MTNLDRLHERIAAALVDQTLTEANGGRPHRIGIGVLPPTHRARVEGNARSRADAVMAVIGPELERLQTLADRVESAVWVSPDRHSGSACIGGTRVPAHIVAGLVPDVGVHGVARFYPGVCADAARAAVWFTERYIDRADHDDTEVTGARDRARQITGEAEQ